MSLVHIRATDDLRETLAMYAFGLLDENEASEVARHIEQGCSVCRQELAVFEQAIAELPKAVQQTSPHPRVKQKLMQRVASPLNAVEEPMPGIFVLRQHRGNWKRTPYPGVTVKHLYHDRETQYLTCLLKLEAGAQYPAHHHKGVEQCLVVEGDVRIGAISMSAGDFEWAAADTHHQPIETNDGCVLLIMASTEDEVLA